MKIYLSTLAVLISLVIGSYMPAQAQHAREAIRACYVDYDRYCSHVVPGGGRILACLADNRDKLSHRCAKTLYRVQDNIRYFLSKPIKPRKEHYDKDYLK